MKHSKSKVMKKPKTKEMTPYPLTEEVKDYKKVLAERGINNLKPVLRTANR